MAAQPAEALAATGVTIRDAGPDDDVAGVKPRWVALPESTEEVAAVLRVASEHDLAVVPVGGGTKLHWGRPPERCDVLLDTCCLNQVLEHAAGDLVVRVQAGVTMGQLAEILAREGQELALDVPDPEATVGGTLAAAVAGPRRLRYGTARDLLIGATVVLADGTIAKSGGKVVKNVAGYDLGKLFTGSYGTLGVIAEAAFRLHPLPADRRWVTATYPIAREQVDGHGERRFVNDFPVDPFQVIGPVATSVAEPSAIEIDWPEVMFGPFTVAVLVEGAAAEARAQAVRGLLEAHGAAADVSAEPPPWWGRLPGDEFLVEIRVPPGEIGTAMAEVSSAATGDIRARGSAASAVLHVALPADIAPERAEHFVADVRAGVENAGGRVIVLAAPEEIARRLDRWGKVGALGLMRRVKERFDPGRIMAPGRFPGGI
ncbi:FAD-linked oxidase [Thermopolyspora flexuosa]|uniref:Glycolate oxidase FAD binding subunit n=1 Tax=Thermopolyspora flexuosa TaxID=103836 RepID=A0A543J0H8_9ACTN|nr:FAD-binding oxidoreductase [Thermopolyspora flexuosa]TQM76336.1 glycolate oxidase FAD binding subunit [Thermopolyspora flexuosa]GGM66605.1 FAD-linked oxidase [Thermopolyspora flexuosa]